MRNQSLKAFLKSCVGAALGLAAGLLVCRFAGESPLHVLQVLYRSSFGSGYDFGMTLFYTAPFILTAIAVAIPFRAGLFNIGGEGQLTMGALAAASSGLLFPDVRSPLFSVLFACVMAFLAGGIWGGIAGYLKAKRGSHEVITTIMMNFIAAGISAYAVLYLIKDPNSSQAESVLLPEWFWIRPYDSFNGAPMGNLFLVLIGIVLLFHRYLSKSRWGYHLEATGSNEVASETYGISKEKSWISSLFVAGGFAGLVGIVEILGNSHRFKVGFSADYGFVGIAVALVAQGNILGIIPAALLFGILQKGAASLDFETDKITRDLSYVIQGLIILGVACEGLFDRPRWFLLRKKKEK